MGALNQWRGFAYVAIFLIGLILAVLYVASLPKNPNSDPVSKNVYSSVKSFAASYTVSRTYTSKNNIVINNLWRQTEAISGGNQYACAVSNGQVFCWGDGAYGKLGNGSLSQQLNPVAVTQAAGILADKKVSNISTGTSHTCAVANGLAFCWGYNGNGRLGNGLVSDSSNPVTVTQAAGVLAGKTVTNISAGGDHTCAIANAQAFCWGSGSSGRLGNSSTSQQVNPVPVTQSAGVLAGKSVTDISAGSEHTCAIANGQVYCWGLNNYGQLGTGNTNNSLIPVLVTQAAGVLAGKSVTSISTGMNSTCAVANGQAFCWGWNYIGQLGTGNTNNSLVPVPVTQAAGVLAGKTVTSISTRAIHVCAVANGQAFCWGEGSAGRLGHGVANSSSAPVAVNVSGVFAGKTVSSITASTHNSCAIANGRAYCWGWNNYGQLGEGTTVLQKLAPHRVNDSYY